MPGRCDIPSSAKLVIRDSSTEDGKGWVKGALRVLEPIIELPRGTIDSLQVALAGFTHEVSLEMQSVGIWTTNGHVNVNQWKGSTIEVVTQHGAIEGTYEGSDTNSERRPTIQLVAKNGQVSILTPSTSCFKTSPSQIDCDLTSNVQSFALQAESQNGPLHLDIKCPNELLSQTTIKAEASNANASVLLPPTWQGKVTASGSPYHIITPLHRQEGEQVTVLYGNRGVRNDLTLHTTNGTAVVEIKQS
ncbi:hypothetical protein R3P38DRAFT_2815203 [Favolaschia claudopus]|uniref:Adhesin domain-containing protein n=1 Tax=Favolaschia claudopus TaxID=2862362 RepID=A0AAV9Z1M3_9AGAR